MQKISEKKIERIEYLDCLKTVAVIFMISYHTLQFTYDPKSVVSRFYYVLLSMFSCCVPIFFAINGRLLLNKKYDSNKNIKKIIHLLLIFLSWDVIDVTVTAIMFEEKLELKEYIKILWNMTGGWNNHLWFILSLTMVYLIFPVVKNVYDSNEHIFKYFLVVVFLFTIANRTIGMAANYLMFIWDKSYDFEYFNFFNLLNFLDGIYGFTIFYFMCGGLIKKYEEKMKKMNSIPIVVGLILCVAGLFNYGTMMTKMTGITYDICWGGYDTIFTLGITLLMFAITIRYNYRNGIFRRMILLVGKNSFGIYLLQTLVLNISKRVIGNRLDINNVLSVIIYIFIALTICLILSEGIKKIPVIKYLVRF